ncbi:MAG: cytochrome c [Gammaproteobacteria bacterium]
MAKSVIPLAGVIGITVATVLGHGPDPEWGREIYVTNCAVCHGRYAEGDGPAMAALDVGAPDLTEIARRRGGYFPYDEIRGIVDGRRDVAEHGGRLMPVWGAEFTMASGDEDRAWDQIEAVVAYLESVQVEVE